MAASWAGKIPVYGMHVSQTLYGMKISNIVKPDLWAQLDLCHIARKARI